MCTLSISVYSVLPQCSVVNKNIILYHLQCYSTYTTSPDFAPKPNASVSLGLRIVQPWSVGQGGQISVRHLQPREKKPAPKQSSTSIDHVFQPNALLDWGWKAPASMYRCNWSRKFELMVGTGAPVRSLAILPKSTRCAGSAARERTRTDPSTSTGTGTSRGCYDHVRPLRTTDIPIRMERLIDSDAI